MKIKQHFTLSQPEVRNFYKLVAAQHPNFVGVSITSIFCDWITVHVPNWPGTEAQFNAMVNP